MRAKRTGRVKEVWKSKEDGWCMRQTIDDNRNVTLTFICPQNQHDDAIDSMIYALKIMREAEAHIVRAIDIARNERR